MILLLGSTAEPGDGWLGVGSLTRLERLESDGWMFQCDGVVILRVRAGGRRLRVYLCLETKNKALEKMKLRQRGLFLPILNIRPPLA